MPQFRSPQPNQYPPQQWQGQPPPQSQWQPQWQEHPSQSLHPNTGYQQQSGPQWPTQQPVMYSPQLPIQPDGYPPQQPPKKSRRGRWIVISVLAAVMLLSGVGIAAIIASTGQAAQSSVNTTLTSNTTVVSTSAATTGGATTVATSSTSGGTWTTTHTFTSNGTKKTATFTVGNDWKIIYSCSGMARIAENGYLGVYIHGSNGSIADPAAINVTCKFSSPLTKGETEEHQGGQVYLDITGTGDWTVIVQEPK